MATDWVKLENISKFTSPKSLKLELGLVRLDASSLTKNPLLEVVMLLFLSPKRLQNCNGLGQIGEYLQIHISKFPQTEARS